MGDEPKQIKRKFPRTVVVVCEKRREGIVRIRRAHPEVNLILMDDGFQHRRVVPTVNIVLVDYTRPVYTDHLLPWGHLRDLKSQMKRADIVVVTKTPADVTPIDRRLMVKRLRLFPYQSLFFTTMQQGKPEAVFGDMANTAAPMRNVAVMSGIGNPGPLSAELKKRYNVVATFTFPEHPVYRVRDLRKVVDTLELLPPDNAVITTEKDGVKLTNRKQIPEVIQQKLYTIPVKLLFADGEEDKFIKPLYKNVRKG